MRSLDRESLALIRERLPQIEADHDQAEILRAGTDVRSVGMLLIEQPRLRRILSNPGVPEEIRVTLLDDLVASRLSSLGHQVVGSIVRRRWRTPLSLLDAFDAVAGALFLASADKEGALPRVEDELFRLWRTLQVEPQLVQALGDEGVPLGRRTALLGDLIEGQAHPTTFELMRMALTQPGGLTVLPAVERALTLAAEAHRSQIAFVTSAVELDEDQINRLAEQLGQERGGPVDVKVTVDGSLIGGMIVRIGDQMIDGSVARRLRDARAGIARAV